MVDSADQQFRFASYFSHLVRDPEARKRWESYAAFIQEAKKAAPKLEIEAKQVAAQLNNPELPEAKRAELQTKSNDLQSKLDLNKALLEAAPSVREAGPMWAVYGVQTRAGKNWAERHFDVQGVDKTAVPKPNDIVTAFDNVTIRGSTPVWDDATHKPYWRLLLAISSLATESSSSKFWITIRRLTNTHGTRSVCHVCRRNEAV